MGFTIRVNTKPLIAVLPYTCNLPFTYAHCKYSFWGRSHVADPLRVAGKKISVEKFAAIGADLILQTCVNVALMSWDFHLPAFLHASVLNDDKLYMLPALRQTSIV